MMDVTKTGESVDRSVGRWAPTTLRITAAFLWLSNVSWKVPPDFGQVGDRCSGLCGYANAGGEFQVLPGSSWFFDSVVSPNLTAFGWMTLFVEAGLAATLLSGRFIRIAAVVGMVQSLGIGLAVANAEGEWYWSYALMITLHLAILVTAPNQRPTPRRIAASATAAYGVLVILAHRSGGFTGDGSFTLFEQRNDFPGDFGRNVFPGSIALGVLFVVLAAAAWLLADRFDDLVRPVGYGMAAVAALLLVTYGQDGLLIGLQSRATTAAALGGLGLALAATSSPPRAEAGPTIAEVGTATNAGH